MVLSKHGVKIYHALNGKEAVQLFTEHPETDLILMDIQMPEMNGYIATKKIKSINEDIPIIAQTAYAMHDQRKKCLESGCDDYISKPIEINVLINSICNQLKYQISNI